MLKAIKRLLERSRYVICISLTVLVIYLSLGQTADLMVAIDVSDKSLHGFAYFGLSLSWMFAIHKSHSSFKWKVYIGFALFLLGVLLEFLQGNITDYRATDYLDAIANTIGIIIAVISFRNLLRLYHSF